MDDHQRSDSQNSGDDPESKPKDHSLILDSQGHEYAKPPAAPKPKGHKIKAYFAKLTEDRPDRLVELIFSGAIVFFSAVTLIITVLNNVSTSKATEQLLTAAGRIDDAADSFARSSANINQGMSGAVAQLQHQAEKMDDARTSSEATSQKSLQAAIDNFHQDQRAWLGICDIGMLQFEDGKPIVADAKICNTGKTPANHVRAKVGFKTSPIALVGPSAEDLKHGVYTESQSVPPQGSYISFMGLLSGKELEPTQYETESLTLLDRSYPLIKAGTVILYYFGDIAYTDAFGKSHRTRFCFFLADPTKKALLYCRNYNDMD